MCHRDFAEFNADGSVCRRMCEPHALHKTRYCTVLHDEVYPLISGMCSALNVSEQFNLRVLIEMIRKPY